MTGLVVVPYRVDAGEAARLIDADASPIASVLASDEAIGAMRPGEFRDAALAAALAYLGAPTVAGVLFAARWGGGGVMIT